MGTWQLNGGWREGKIVFDVMKCILQPVGFFERYPPRVFSVFDPWPEAGLAYSR
jgi:hypothetical protein